MTEKPAIFKEALKIWDEISAGEAHDLMKFELEIHKKLLNFFQVGDYYYYVFNVKHLAFDLMSKEVEQVLGYKPEELDVPFLLSKIHPDDQPWFLNFESKTTEFFKTLSLDQIPNYKVRYDYRIKKSTGDYLRILQQVVTIQFNEEGGILKTFGIHTDISHLKPEGKPVLSFIGLNGEPSYIDVDTKEAFSAASHVISKRERDILSLLAAGKKSKEIASDLNISIATVATHRKNLLRKTNQQNTVEMVTMAIKKGWV